MSATKAATSRRREGLEPALIPERVMVCMSSAEEAPRVLRTGARIAGRLGARWYAVYVETPREAPGRIAGAEREALAAQHRHSPKAWARPSYACGRIGPPTA